jgi:hypothetical protein
MNNYMWHNHHLRPGKSNKPRNAKNDLNNGASGVTTGREQPLAQPLVLDAQNCGWSWDSEHLRWKLVSP